MLHQSFFLIYLPLQHGIFAFSQPYMVLCFSQNCINKKHYNSTYFVERDYFCYHHIFLLNHEEYDADQVRK